MEKSKSYYKTRFSVDTLQAAYNLFTSKLSEKDGKIPHDRSVTYGNETWKYDNNEEFFAGYETADSYSFAHGISNTTFNISGDASSVYVSIRCLNRKDIVAIFQIFEDNLSNSILTADEPCTIFIGHGNSHQWRDLKDHLHEQHGFDVTAYEIGPRAGLSVKDVLASMLDESSFSFLVLTGEDIDAYGETHARENVIHELGLFQGRLGFKRAIILLEEGVYEFSNILGLNQIRFSKDNIRETFGDVLATIKRELTEDDN